MSIVVGLTGVSKRFKRDWVIQNLNHRITASSKTAILGKNGSGKSTLLKIICGFVSPTEGEVNWKKNAENLDQGNWHHYFSYVAPYLELIEEYTLQESLDFHFSLKSLRPDIDLDNALKSSGLFEHKQKQISNFSSGMKQRLKLILALYSEVPIYLLDEPCSNLDVSGIEWYQEVVAGLPEDKIVIVASNNKEEYSFCTNTITVLKYK
jgi:ABC-type multidrug transport system ATPase subunit